jgi:iron complex transport system permease protein
MVMAAEKEDRRIPYALLVLGLGVALVAVIVFSFFLGRYPIPPRELFSILLSRVLPIEQFWSDQMATISLTCGSAHRPGLSGGGSLSAAGASYQAYSRTHGSAGHSGRHRGAAFGAALAIINEGNQLTITLYASSSACSPLPPSISSARRRRARRCWGWCCRASW